MNTNSKRTWLLVLLALVIVFAAGVGVALFLNRTPAVAEVPVKKAPPEPAEAPAVVEVPPAPPRIADANAQRRAQFENRIQDFMAQMTPEQQGMIEDMRLAAQQNAADWNNLSPEERQQRAATFMTNNLRMSPQAAERMQSALNPTPEQREQMRLRIQQMQDRFRNGNGNGGRPPRNPQF